MSRTFQGSKGQGKFNSLIFLVFALYLKYCQTLKSKWNPDIWEWETQRLQRLLSGLQVPVDEVCGCPLVKNVFELTGEFCRVSKRKCNKHYNWEKLRRAEVDLERVRVVSRLSRCDVGGLVFILRVTGYVKSQTIRNFFVAFGCFFVPQWYKLDELFEQERNVRTAMTNRAGLLALMLHQTIQHDPLTTDLRGNKDR